MSLDLKDIEVGEYGLVYVCDHLDDGRTWLGLYDDEGSECDEYPDGCPEDCYHQELAIVYPYLGSPLTSILARRYRLLPFWCLKRFPVQSICTSSSVPPRTPCFYIVLLSPELSMRRVKMGRSLNLHSRMKSYRCSNPNAILIGAWPAAPEREEHIRQHLAKLASGQRIGDSEVYDVDLEKLIEAANEYLGAPTERLP